MRQNEEQREITVLEEYKEKHKIGEELLILKINQLERTVSIDFVKNIYEIDDYIFKMEGFMEESDLQFSF